MKKIFGQKLKKLRTSLQCTQGMMGRLFGVSSRTIARVEQGEAYFHPDFVNMINLFLEVETEILKTLKKQNTTLEEKILFDGVAETLYFLLSHVFKK